MSDLINREAVNDAVQAWIDSKEYKDSNNVLKLLQRLYNVPNGDPWKITAEELPKGVLGYEPCMLVNVIGTDGVKGCGYYNEEADNWYLLLDTPTNNLFLTVRDRDYVACWRPLPDK